MIPTEVSVSVAISPESATVVAIRPPEATLSFVRTSSRLDKLSCVEVEGADKTV